MGTDQHSPQQESDNSNEEKAAEEDGWMNLPTEPLITILFLLNHRDLARCSQVCRRWNEITNLDFLWRRRILNDFEISADVPMLSSANSWKAEYQRITDLVPSVEFERISEHTDEVLHVSFSNNGMMFCTTSKDATVKVFNADWPFDTLFNQDLGQASPFRWKYTQLSQFSSSDTQLLVSGRCAGSEHGGEIIIYNIFAGEFTLQARVRIKPYDVMGAWLNETHILSANTYTISHERRCLCEVSLNKSSQEIDDLKHSNVSRAFMFKCENFNTVSYLQVADLKKTMTRVQRSIHLGCFQGKLHEMHVKALSQVESSTQPSSDPSPVATDANSLKVASGDSGLDQDSRETSNSNESKKMKFDEGWQGNEDPLSHGEPSGLNLSLPSIRRCKAETDNDSESSFLFSGTGSPQLTDDELDKYESESTEVTTGDEAGHYSKMPQNYKLLLCFTGSTYSAPHQIGIKRITQEECTEVVCPDFELSKLRHRDSFHSTLNRPVIHTDDWDHVIELNGQVVGMALTPCNRFLFVNSRKWSSDNIDDDFDWPAISSEVTMRMFDLITMEEVRCFTNHKAESSVFFLHISCNYFYVASGSENKHGYLWDKHYGILLATFRHDDVVNSVAVNPRDPQMAVSVSDDHLIKIWRSKSFHRLLKGARAKSRSKVTSV